VLRRAFKLLCIVVCLVLIAPAFPRAQEEKKSSSDWIYYLLGTGGIIYLLLHHHPHTVSPSPTPSPTPTPTPTIPPTVERTPTIVVTTPTPVPTPTPCSYRLTDGWFEPAQGPFQDDPTFVEKPAVLDRSSSAFNNIQYYAPLYMVEDRPTVLTGVDHYRDIEHGGIVHINSRDAIVFKGETNCTKPAGVSLNFTLLEHGARLPIYSTGVLAQIPLSGKGRKTFSPFIVTLRAKLGIPPSDTFTISRTTPDYAIVGEIVKHDGGGGTGMRVTVEGIATETIGPQLLIVPTLLSNDPARDSGTMTYMSSLARIWQRDLYDNVPDIYPLRPYGLPMPQIAPPLDLTGQVLETFLPGFGSQADSLVAAVGDRLATMGTLSGAGRIVVMLREHDYQDFARKDYETNGVSWNSKVVVVKDRAHNAWITVAHEVAHTLPEYPWSSEQMLSECGLDYHNTGGPIAHGLKIMFLSMTGSRLQLNNSYGLLQGSFGFTTTWITQCTYHNLIYALMQKVDPPITLVRGFIGRSSRGEAARFAPSYDLMGAADLRTTGKGAYAFVVHSPDGKAVTYRFTPAFRNENGRLRAIVSFGYHIPRPADGSRIALLGPHGTLATQVRSLHAPTLVIAQPLIAKDRRSIHLHWSAASSGRKLLASVLTSQNARLFWPYIFERHISSADIPVDVHARSLRIKVIVTDGSRSTGKTILVIIPRSIGDHTK
jgi:hypothetical protein